MHIGYSSLLMNSEIRGLQNGKVYSDPWNYSSFRDLRILEISQNLNSSIFEILILHLCDILNYIQQNSGS